MTTSLFPPVMKTLKASSEVSALLGSSNPFRVFHRDAPQDTSRPYVTWQLTADAPENHLSGTPPTDRTTILVNCWAPGEGDVGRLGKAVRDACESLAYLTGVPFDGRDPETKLYRIALQFDWFVDRDR
jgi:hypothetical protein